MVYRSILAAALGAGKPLNPQIGHTLLARDTYLYHAAEAIGDMLSSTPGTGHAHDVDTTHAITYYHQDAIETFTSGDLANHKFDFKFGDSGFAAETFEATLTQAIGTNARSPSDFADHLESAMRTAIEGRMGGSPGDGDNLHVSFVDPITQGDDPDRGRLKIEHRGATDSPNARVLQLLLNSGSNTAQSAGPRAGFAKGRDRIGSLTYVADSGFLHGFKAGALSFGDGGQIDTDGLASSSGTNAKFADNVVQSTHFQAGAVGVANAADGAFPGQKWGAPWTAESSGTVAAGSSTTFDVELGDGRLPCARVSATTGTGKVSWFDIYITSIGHLGGGVWRFTVKNGSDRYAIVTGEAVKIRLSAY